MAEEAVVFQCITHGDQVVTWRGTRTAQLSCRCVLEIKDGQFHQAPVRAGLKRELVTSDKKNTTYVMPGDIVRWVGALYIVDWAEPSEEGRILGLHNAYDDAEAHEDDVEFVGTDTISPRTNRYFSPPMGTLLEHPTVAKEKKKKKKGQLEDTSWRLEVYEDRPAAPKKNNISTADLIKQEVKDLEKSNSSTAKQRPLRTAAPTTPPKDTKETPAVDGTAQPFRRKGDW